MSATFRIGETVLLGLLGFVAGALFAVTVFGEGPVWELELGSVRLAVRGFPDLALLIAAALVLGHLGGRVLIGSQPSLRLVGICIAVLETPVVFAHNSVNWGLFASWDPFPARLGATGTAITVILSIAAWLALDVADRLHALGGVLQEQGVERRDRRALLGNWAVSLAGVVGGSLAVALVVLALAGGIGASDALFRRLPWTVLTVGLGATLLTAGALLAWASGQRPRREEEPG